MNCKKFQLKNGLTVLFVQSHKSPVVSIQMWVRTGSADESKSLEGISHFIEHLVFKGTDKYGPGQIANLVEGSGGELNAYTSFDQTVFYVTLSKLYTEIGLDIVSQMMGFPKFDKGEIDSEREVVIEEIRRGNDSPGRKSSQILFKNAFKGHPYSIPVIGYEKVIKKVSKEKLVQYFNSRYVPENMFLVVAGDFESVEMKSKVLNYFGGFKPFKLKKSKRPKIQKIRAPKIKIDQSKFKDDQIHISFPIPGGTHKDIAALDLASLILGQGDSSRLVHKLRIENHFVQGVGASTFSPIDGGVFSLSFGIKSDQAKEAFPAALSVLEGFLNNPATEQELIKAHVSFESEMIFSSETVDALARRYGNLEFSYHDPNFGKKYLQQVKKIDWKALKTTIKKYLDPDKMIITGLSHEPQKVTPELKKFAKEYKKIYQNVYKQKTQVKIKKFKTPTLSVKNKSKNENITHKQVLKNGITLLSRFNSETSLISVRSCYMGGIRIEPTDKFAVTELCSRSWVCRTKDYSEQEIYSILESSGSGVSGFSGRNTMGLSYDGLSAFEKIVAPIYMEILTEPKVDQEVFEREKKVLLNQIKSKTDSASQLTMQKIQEVVFEDHPYAKDPTGTLEQASQTELSDVQDFFKKFISPKNLTVSLAGNFDLEFWISRLEKIPFSNEKPRVSDSFNQKEFKKDKIYFRELQREQTHIALALKGLTLSSKERFTLEIISSILSGQGGRLFIELRDKNSLAYSVSPIKMDGIDAGYFGAYIACSPEKTPKAIQMMKEELNKLANEPVPIDELNRAKKYIVGRHDIDLQKNNTISMSLLMNDVYDLGLDEVFDIAKKYADITPEGVQNLAKRLFQKPSVISIVGPRSSIEHIQAETW